MEQQFPPSPKAAATAFIPHELANLVDEEFSELIRTIASLYLARPADINEVFYVTRMKREVSALPGARSFDERELASIVKMVVAGVRARLYPLRGSSRAGPPLGFRSNDTPNGPVRPKGFLCSIDYRLWPLLLILDPARTRLLVYCVSGLIDGRAHRDTGGPVACGAFADFPAVEVGGGAATGP
jgi:hypothetical protein